MTATTDRNGFASPRTARHYDAQLPLERRALAAALELAAPRPDDRVLDLATGTGALLRAMATGPAPPREALGLDASPAMLAHVPPLPEGWSTRVGDARATGLPDASVDLVTSAFLVHLLSAEDRAAVLAEIARVLAPGGRTVLVSLAHPRGAAGRALFGPLQAGLCRALGPASGWCAHDPRPDLRAAGLTTTRARLATRGYASWVVRAER